MAASFFAVASPDVFALHPHEHRCQRAFPSVASTLGLCVKLFVQHLALRPKASGDGAKNQAMKVKHQNQEHGHGRSPELCPSFPTHDSSANNMTRSLTSVLVCLHSPIETLAPRRGRDDRLHLAPRSASLVPPVSLMGSSSPPQSPPTVVPVGSAIAAIVGFGGCTASGRWVGDAFRGTKGAPGFQF